MSYSVDPFHSDFMASHTAHLSIIMATHCWAFDTRDIEMKWPTAPSPFPLKPDRMVHTYYSSIWETEAHEWQVQGQPGLHRDPVSTNKQK
jgi:hypothetical protein